MKGFIILVVVAAVAYLLYQAYQSAKLETSESRTIKHLPPSVQQVVASMDPQTQNTFFNEYLKKRKRKSVGWILQLIPITWHYLYAGNVGLQFAFWFTGGGFGIWWLIDLFRMPSIIRGANERIARDAIQTIGSMAAFGRGAGTNQFPATGQAV